MQPLPGVQRTADLLFTRVNLAVFVDGCFWHGCPDHYVAPKANADYWRAKLLANKSRDRDTDARLAAAECRSLRVWEHVDPVDAADLIERSYWELRSVESTQARPSRWQPAAS